MVADNFREIGTRLLTPLARSFPLDPMGISLLSLATAVGAGYSFSQAEAGSVWLLFAAGLVFLTALLDALDGIVARIRDLTSKRGDLVDHTLDRVADVIILGGIALGPLVNERAGFAALLGVLLLSYMGTQAQAVGAGRVYSGLLGRADRLVLLMAVPVIQFFFVAPIEGEYLITWMAYTFAIVCSGSALLRFWLVWKFLEK
ncbi:MAG: CDP-alcohol phosphatidyltransferase family protein [Candidatus Poseidoniia archaeon]|nr:CDP-alcohol phosphatidyltransferase family protein [Candidatus Poseidoniia archaeon]MDP7607958.1 CDP-alcohol phosphatidyltransferase family protein [Candidatus Poseidoniia archaeon]|tara:strand:- start:519 stop:1124 length:606 start_codon:yes stop_codon:yes gene_type:complete